MQYKNITFIGTSHISQDSVDSVKDFIENEKPGIVAIELDRDRAIGLMQGVSRKPQLSDIKHIGVKGFLFMIIAGYAQKKLGEYVKLDPGSEMKIALTLAKKNNIKVALVDQDVKITLNRLSKRITWKEKGRFIIDIFSGFFKKQKTIEFDLKTVPDNKIIKKLISQLKERYPSLYDVLIAERNEVIANNLYNIMNQNLEEKILVVLGAGHVEDVIELLKKKDNITYNISG